MGNPVRRKLHRAKSLLDEAAVLERYTNGPEAAPQRCLEAWLAYLGHGRSADAKKAAFTYAKLSGPAVDYCNGIRTIIAALRNTTDES